MPKRYLPFMSKNIPSITGIHKNCVGTTSFSGKFPGMRKPQDFTVYPMQDSGTIISIQSDNRFGEIDLADGSGIISTPRNYANGMWLQICQIRKTAKPFTLATEDVQTLRQWIKSTGSPAAGGTHGIIVDNTGAMGL